MPSRFVLVTLRGGLDGLAAVAPYGDPALRPLRPGLVLPEPGQDGGLLDLGGFWGLHPKLPHMHAMYAAGELLIVHAVSGPYRTRSHFEALNLLEIGADRGTSGWLNRVAAELPESGDYASAVALGAVTPLLLTGPTRVGGWTPPRPNGIADRFLERVAELYADDARVSSALAERRFAARVVPSCAGRGIAFPEQASVAGRLLASEGGPRIAALDLEGWDTHAGQAGRIGWAMQALDDGMAALKDALGGAWAETAVLVMTEFGRTVRMNGVLGTDHGTAGVAFVAGGCIDGGTVRGDWPGLADAALYEDRDLQPTTDIRAIAKGLLGPHLGRGGDALARIFPGTGPVAMSHLLRH